MFERSYPRAATRCCLSGILFLLGAGCAAQAIPKSGFLGDYPPMVPSQRAKGAHVWLHPSIRVSDYSKFIIDPVAVMVDAEASQRAVEPEELDSLADYFRNEITSRILSSGKYQVVQNPGPGVLRMRAAITDVAPSNVRMNIVGPTRWSGLGTGGAAMEAEFIDTATDQRIAAVIASEKGNPVKIEEGMTKWGHTEAVLSKWAQILREALDNRWISGGYGNMRR